MVMKRLRMYKGLVDNGMSNTKVKAGKYVTNQIKTGKLTSAPLKGSLVVVSKVVRSSRVVPSKSGKRVIKLLGPSIVRKASRNIPVIGPIIVGVTSLLSGEPVTQALFKVGGTLIGGLLGLPSFLFLSWVQSSVKLLVSMSVT